jgi:hypothetical protein
MKAWIAVLASAGLLAGCATGPYYGSGYAYDAYGYGSPSGYGYATPYYGYDYYGPSYGYYGGPYWYQTPGIVGGFTYYGGHRDRGDWHRGRDNRWSGHDGRGWNGMERNGNWHGERGESGRGGRAMGTNGTGRELRPGRASGTRPSGAMGGHSGGVHRGAALHAPRAAPSRGTPALRHQQP